MTTLATRELAGTIFPTFGDGESARIPAAQAAQMV